MAKNSISRGLPGPSETEPEVAAGTCVCIEGPMPRTNESERRLRSLGWCGSRLEASWASSWPAWVMDA